jgi:hypothetical protein
LGVPTPADLDDGPEQASDHGEPHGESDDLEGGVVLGWLLVIGKQSDPLLICGVSVLASGW